MLHFLEPAIFAALASLPIVWWLLRRFPPTPEKVIFPSLAIIKQLHSQPRTNRKTPPWLLIFRITLLMFAILAFAKPYFDSNKKDMTAWNNIAQSSKVIIIVDDGYGFAQNSSSIKQSGDRIINTAGINNAQTAVISASDAATIKHISFTNTELAKAILHQISPKAYLPDRTAIIQNLHNSADYSSARIFWLSDGLDANDSLIQEAKHKPDNFFIFKPELSKLPVCIKKIESSVDGFDIDVERLSQRSSNVFTIEGRGRDNSVILTETRKFETSALTANVIIKPAREVRNHLTRLTINGGTNACAVWLMDDESAVKSAGIITSSNADNQPFLQEKYYLTKALEGYAQIDYGNVDELLKAASGLLILPDSTIINTSDSAKLQQWVENGGILLRFAGKNLEDKLKAGDTEDILLPVKISSIFSYGGIANISGQQKLKKFEEKIPLANLSYGSTVNIRKLAIPATQSNTHEVWARLEDGSPLITSQSRKSGRIIFVHTTANNDWSDFALSGTFVSFVQNILSISGGTHTVKEGFAKQTEELDGYGNLTSITTANDIKDIQSLRSNPEKFKSGYYSSGQASIAVNMGRSYGLTPINYNAAIDYNENTGSKDFTVILAIIAAIMLGIDSILSLVKTMYKSAQKMLVTLFITFALIPTQSLAKNSSEENPAFKTTIAYVQTGNAKLDRSTEAGITRLSNELANRTSAICNAPVSINLERDDISLYPILYVPIYEGTFIGVDGMKKLHSFIRTGGLVIFDTMDGADISTALSVNPVLIYMLNAMGVSNFEKVNDKHVLLKTFYLLKEIRGRFDDSTTLVEKADENVNDGVSPIIITSAALAQGLSVDENGGNSHIISGGSEKDGEMIVRSGINIAMYALTGNYKADKIHTNIIEEREKH